MDTQNSSHKIKMDDVYSEGLLAPLAVKQSMNVADGLTGEAEKGYNSQCEAMMAIQQDGGSPEEKPRHNEMENGASLTCLNPKENAYNVPVKFENPPSLAEKGTPHERFLQIAEHTESSPVDEARFDDAQQVHVGTVSSQSLARTTSPACRRATRKPQFTQRVWRVDIVGFALDRWRSIGVSKDLESDAEIASFLMQHYEDTLAGCQSAVRCTLCDSPLALICILCNLTNSRSRAKAEQSVGCAVDVVGPPSSKPAHISTAGEGSESSGWDEDETAKSLADAGHDHCCQTSVKKDKADRDVQISISKPVRCHKRRPCRSKPRALSPQTLQTSPSAAKLPKQCAAKKRSVREQSSTDKKEPNDLKNQLSKTMHKPAVYSKKDKSRTETGRLVSKKTDASSSGAEFSVLREEVTTARIQPASKATRESASVRRRSHICKECGSAFTRSGGLKVHMRIHTGEKPYRCDECGLAFNQIVSLTVHKRKHSGERPYVCTECNASFPLASTLKQHARIHSGERPYKCQHCPKTFARSGDLTSHMRMHTGLKPFLCHDCGKRFASSSDLTKHKRTHTGDRPFECQHCHKRFPFPHRLTAHMRSHTGDKPYLCTVCGAKFARASNLTVHFRIHTGDKPFECEECGKRFSDSGNLCKHRRSSHGGTRKKVEKIYTSSSDAILCNAATTVTNLDCHRMSVLAVHHVSVPTGQHHISKPAGQHNVSVPVGQEMLPQTASTTESNLPNHCDGLSGGGPVSEERTQVTRTSDRFANASSSLNGLEPSLGKTSSTADGQKGLLPSVFHGAEDGFVIVNSSATVTAEAMENVDGHVKGATKCRDNQGSFSNPNVMSKGSRMLHSAIDKGFVAVGNVEHCAGPAMAYPEVMNDGMGGSGQGQDSLLPYLNSSNANLGYYYHQ